jgi:hypothetical protein
MLGLQVQVLILDFQFVQKPPKKMLGLSLNLKKPSYSNLRKIFVIQTDLGKLN